ncbi:hypothetical protein CENTIMANUS_00349 [Klebsiella phage vB_KpM_Centimanus]
MALKKCLKQQRSLLKQSSITKNHLFLIKIGKQYIDGIDSGIHFFGGRRCGRALLNARFRRCVDLGGRLKNRVHYRHGLKQFSVKGL